MFSKSFFSLLAYLFLAAIIFQSCREQVTQPSVELKQNSAIVKNSEGIQKLDKISDTELKILAKDLALILNQENIREFLEANIKESKYDEQILEASEFLNKELIINN